MTLGGDDMSAFKLDKDETDNNYFLRFEETPNYESPTDANMDSTYKVTIIATDKEGSPARGKSASM